MANIVKVSPQQLIQVEAQKEKKLVTKKCVMCDIIVSRNAGIVLTHSYGGKQSECFCCSEECYDKAIELPIKWGRSKSYSNWMKR